MKKYWLYYIFVSLPYIILLFSPVFLDEGQYIDGAKYLIEHHKLYGGTTIVNGEEVPYAEDMPHPPGLIILLALFNLIKIPLFLQRLFFLFVTIIGFLFLIKILNIDDREGILLLSSSFVFVFSSSSLMTDMTSAMFLWGSIYYFKKDKYRLFTLFYALSLIFRYSAIIALPYFLYYGRKKIIPYLILSSLPLIAFLIYSSFYLHISQMSVSYKWSARSDFLYTFIRRFGYYSVITVSTMPLLLFYTKTSFKKILISLLLSLLYLFLTHQVLVSLFVFVFIIIILCNISNEYILIVLSGILLVLFAFPMGSLRYALPFLPFIINIKSIKRIWYINAIVSIILAFSLLYYNMQIKNTFEKIGMKYENTATLFGWGGKYYGERYGITMFNYKNANYDYIVYPLISKSYDISDSLIYYYVPEDWYGIKSFMNVSILPVLSSYWGKYIVNGKYVDKLILLKRNNNKNCIYNYYPSYVSNKSRTNFSEFVFYKDKVYKGIFAHAPDTILFDNIPLSEIDMGLYIFPSKMSDGVSFKIIVDDTLMYSKTLQQTGVMDTLSIYMENNSNNLHKLILITSPGKDALCDWSVFIPLNCKK